MKRYLHDRILQDLKRKMVFITGPRQVGKTYLAKQIMEAFKIPQYLNYDAIEDKNIIHKQSWRLDADLLIFDEIHKLKNWKNFLKGVYDTKRPEQSVLVTGSARLDAYRQSGDSLAGRYFHLRLNPLSVKEVKDQIDPYTAIEKFNELGTFPEPFLSDSKSEANRWRNQYYTGLIREDILEFSRIHEINTMRTMLELLKMRVASPLSYTSLAEDLKIAPNTVKKYVQILESLYIIFLLRPYHEKIARSINKEPKLYFYDSGYVEGDEGVRLENTCAVCLLKYCQYLYDAEGANYGLFYLRTKDNKEIDFAITKDDKPQYLIEVKLRENKPSSSFTSFANYFPDAECIQLVHQLRQEEHWRNVDILPAGEWLGQLPV